MNNIINAGDKFYIYGDGVKVSKKLPAQAYTVKFDPMAGWWLEKAKEPIVGSDKIYGVLMKRVEKVLSSYERMNRNMGVILSGAKGIGKSLFARIISKKAIENDLPVIYITENIDGLANFLATIDQRCLILFDEFDKVFYNSSRDEENKSCSQDSFLTLFDGVYASNKLFVITANDLGKLSEFLLNRPGRFRYHLRFDYPNEEETKEFLKDKLDKSVKRKEITEILRFTSIVPLSYDCLTAIADELNNGETFESCLEVLNIINVMEEHYYSGTIVFEDGDSYKLDYLGSINFFNKSNDRNIVSTYFCNSSFLGSNDRIADIGFVQGEVRKNAKFLHDGTVIIPYNKGKGFQIRKNRKNRLSKNLGIPKEIVLTCSAGMKNVSFKDVVL